MSHFASMSFNPETAYWSSVCDRVFGLHYITYKATQGFKLRATSTRTKLCRYTLGWLHSYERTTAITLLLSQIRLWENYFFFHNIRARETSSFNRISSSTQRNSQFKRSFITKSYEPDNAPFHSFVQHSRVPASQLKDPQIESLDLFLDIFYISFAFTTWHTYHSTMSEYQSYQPHIFYPIYLSQS